MDVAFVKQSINPENCKGCAINGLEGEVKDQAITGVEMSLELEGSFEQNAYPGPRNDEAAMLTKSCLQRACHEKTIYIRKLEE